MGSLERRLRDLEERAGGASEAREHEEAAWREVLRRMTDDELHRYDDVLERFETAGEVGDEDLPILRRVEELREEVRDEFTQKA